MCCIIAEIATVIAPYDATSSEQLPLQLGQLIQIRRKTDTGWWEGELQVCVCVCVGLHMSLLTCNNSNNRDVSVYHGDVIMAIAIVRVLRNERQIPVNSQTKPTNLDCESAFKLLPSTAIISVYYYHTHTFVLWLFSGTTRVRWCQNKSSSGVYGARGDIRGRHNDNPAGCHSIRTNQWPISLPHPPFLCRMLFLPQPY